MKLTLKKKGLRQFTVLFVRQNVHVFHLPEDSREASDRIYRILDEVNPGTNAREFFDEMNQAVASLSRSHHENRPTSFYCGDVCLTLEN